MEQLKYKIIKSQKQYFDYCMKLEDLVSAGVKQDQDEIELLTLLIEKWDENNFVIPEIDPIQMIKSLLKQNNLNATDLARILTLSKGTVSKILNYKKGLSKETIRILATHFAMSQEVFNRPYVLRGEKGEVRV